MKRKIHHKVIMTIAGLAVIVAGFGMSSRAEAGEDREIERVIATILGIAVLGAILADDEPQPQVSHDHRPARIKPRPLPPRIAKTILPSHCLRRFETDRGPRRIYTQRCMSRNFDQVTSLPRACERVIRTDRGRRVGWGARCLRESGYQVSRR
jgi:hypothetical protein